MVSSKRSSAILKHHQKCMLYLQEKNRDNQITQKLLNKLFEIFAKSYRLNEYLLCYYKP